MSSSFTHLHVHTEYSILDGASRVGDLVKAAAADGQPALGMTDHGNMYGVIDFYRACRNEGIKPVIGTEAYMAHENRSERPPRRGKVDDSGGSTEGGQKIYYHLTLLAENNTGYKNLIQLSSRAFLEGYYYKPRLDWELLAEHSEGLIASTGCLGGHVLQALLRNDYDGAVAKAARLQDIFGKESLFVEIQDHGIPEQHRTNPDLIRLARQINAPLLATNDSHYTHRHDAEAHDALLCVQTGSLVSDTDRLKFDGSEHYLKTAAEMRQVFSDLIPACDNTLWIAERADVEIEFGKPLLPDFPIPDEYDDADEYLQALTLEGAKARWGSPLSEEVADRLAFELKVISDMGFSSYFLITWDLIRYARERGIRVGPGRGSAAGCAVAYSLRITDLDPIRYDLLFERFLNPSRISMPDIDMDFDSRYRDEIIRYASQKYGEDHVAQIITFSTIKARAAVRDSARVLNYPYALGDKLAKAMPPLVLGRDTPLWACLEKTEEYADGYTAAAELREMYEGDEDARKVVDVARGLEGLRRQDSIHAAAVVITKEPLTEYLPIQRKASPGQTLEEAPIVTQYEMHAVEDLGLLKMDFLGLRNLDVLEDAVGLIEQSQGVKVDIDNVPLDDAATYELLSRGDTIGVFQLESGPMRSLIRSLKPSCFDDVAALVALYRPGPMAANMHNDYADRKNEREQVSVFHEDAADILADTYGLMIYQESVMRVAQRFAGYGLDEADNLRKACGKKDRKLMAKERDSFVEGCERKGYGRELGTELFDIIEQFADYAFNKSHSYGYGLIAYQCAYLKAQYPVEYMAALLTSVKNKLERAAVYLAECRQMGITVALPDVNQSESDFAATNSAEGERAISFGLSAIRHMGTGTAQMILEERKENGPFADFHDFCSRVDPTVLNKGVVEALIKAGGFDAMGHPRQGLLNASEAIVRRCIQEQRERSQGIMSLFGEGSQESFEDRIDIPDVEFDKTRRLAAEKEMLGLYVSDHPIMGMEGVLSRKTTHRIDQLSEVEEGTSVKVGGVVSNLRKRWTRKGDQMASCDLEDMYGTMEVTLFPRSMEEHGHKLEDDLVVVFEGRLDRRDDEPNLICYGVEPLDPASANGTATLRLNLGACGLSPERIDSLKTVIAGHPGKSEVILMLGADRGIKLSTAYGVDAGSGLIGELREMLGENAIAV
ncbi:MAG: DNA polymerase III subunit alpha [Acidimicrobiia bacterium]|nr:DNA polymerase III subunit alpha [Acidimicrobiia bacterium]MCY4434803.1 DNA polymerase III subunit alpha [bacterium]